jgi:hypothetical protein
MLSRVFGRGDMQDKQLLSQASEHGSLFLLGLCWLAAFEKAFRNGLPRLYVDQRDDRTALRGRLDINRQLRNHLAGRNLDRISCQYRELSFNNIIGRTLRWCNRILRGIFSRTDTPALRKLARADQLLASQGVPLGRVALGELDHIHYTSMAEAYRPLVRLSQALISATPERSGGEMKDGKTFLFSMTELWEYYIIEVLNERLEGYSIRTANDEIGLRRKLVTTTHEDSGESVDLFELRPDILVEKDSKTVAILDAKYKWVNTDRVSRDSSTYGIPREDIYQLTTYMTRYSVDSQNGSDMRAGALIYPWPMPFAFRKQNDNGMWNHYRWEAGGKNWKLQQKNGDNAWNLGLIDFALPVWGSLINIPKDDDNTLAWNRPFAVPNEKGEINLVLGNGWKCSESENNKFDLKFDDRTTVVNGLAKKEDTSYDVPEAIPIQHLEDAIDEAESELAGRVQKLIESKSINSTTYSL